MDVFELKNKLIFKALTKTEKIDPGKIHSILDYCDNVLFLWDKSSGCLLTEGCRPECVSYQELHPTSPLEFDVTHVLVNLTGTKVALWGPSGVSILDLPWRCGPLLEYQDGKSSIICRNRSISHSNLSFGSEVVQVRWNPFQINDSSLIVLFSDNSLYQYDMVSGDRINMDKLSLGIQPNSRQRTLAALGETAVDFCFAPFFAESSKEPATILLVLRGNGDINLVVIDAEGDVLEGETLPVSPLPDDHYLTEACAILPVPGKPAAVVIATSRGVMYHTLLLPLDVDQLNLPVQDRQYRLLVVETATIDVGMLPQPEDVNIFPIRLFTDPSHPRRYLVVHPSGVHSVVLEILGGVEQLLQHGSVKKMPESSLEHLICADRPILGCVACHSTLTALDCDNSVISLPLRRINIENFILFAPSDDLNIKRSQGPLTLQIKQPFDNEIGELLKKSPLPYIQVSLANLPKEQALSLVMELANQVRNALTNFQTIRSILNHRKRLIESMKVLQICELKRLESEREEIKANAEGFAEKIQTVADNIADQQDRVQTFLKKMNVFHHTTTDAENKMDNTLTKIETKLPEYNKSLEKLKKNCAYQESKISGDDEVKESTLSNLQISTFHKHLAVMEENIGMLVRKVQDLNDLVGIPSDD